MLLQKFRTLILLIILSNFAQAEDLVLDSLYNALNSSKTAEDKATYLNDIGTIYCVRGEFSTGAKYVLESIKILEALGDTSRLCRRYLNMGNMFSTIDQTTKGIAYLNRSIQLSTIKHHEPNFVSYHYIKISK